MGLCLLVFVDDLEVGVDDLAFVFLLGSGFGVRGFGSVLRRRGTGGAGARHLLISFGEDLLQFLLLRFHRRMVVVGDRLFERVDLFLQRLLLRIGDFVAHVLERLLNLINRGLGLV